MEIMLSLEIVGEPNNVYYVCVFRSDWVTSQLLLHQLRELSDIGFKIA